MEETEKIIIEQAEKLLSLLGLEGSCRLHKEGDYYYLEIESTDSALLIGRYGANLDAFELILNLILAKKIAVLEKVIVDIGGFRKRREEQLISLAQSIAQKVTESGRFEVLLNLSSRERRVVHLALSQDPNIETKSEGEGEGRRLIIQPKRQT